MDTEKGVAGSGWVRQEGMRPRSQWRAHCAKMPKGGWKGGRPKVHLKRTGELVRSPKTICAYEVFTEQGSPASQMTAAKVLDIISRLLGCAGQAADAVSAYTQVKMEDAHQMF